MNIVVLDGHTLNPGDLTWEGLSSLGNLTVYERTPQSEVLSRSHNADILLTNKTIINAGIIEQFKDTKHIGVLATGYNVVDIYAAKAKRITVSNVPAYGPDAVAQHTFALLLQLTNQVGKHAESVNKGDWSNQDDFSYPLTPLISLANKTLGIIGYGNIGKRVARIAHAFGMNVLIYSKSALSVEFGQLVDLKTIAKDSDVISLHCALTIENKEFINSEFLNLMKPSAFILNTSRGPLINENDLAEALKSYKIAGAALDVLSQEPPPLDNVLIGLKNCLVTPHIAWATKEARQNLMNIAVENIRSFIQGHPQNVIN